MSESGRTIDRERLSELLDGEAEHSTVFVPVRTNGHVEFVRREKGSADLAFHPGPPRLSPKAFFFPQTETLYRFNNDEIEAGQSEPDGQKPTVLFAVRPCDAASFGLLDKVFGPENHGFPDPYYQKRRDQTVVVTLACTVACSTCFCTSVGGDPSDRRGADVLAHEIDSSIFFEALTRKGQAFLKRNSALLTVANAAARKEADAAADKARQSVRTVEYNREKAKENLDARFDDAVWQRITNSCIGCGACTYLCPTCHCFDICDEVRHYKGRRIRTWDSCQYAQFTKHASGHNPRPTKVQRLRQRFMHKFSYTVESVNEIYCVGCGRCVKQCPVNLDIREVLREFSS